MKMTERICLTTAWCLAAFCPAHAAAESRARTNIIVILADDLGYETIGAYGGTSYRTPRIDQLAREGLRFGHCYAQPLCTPSRVQLLSGRYNSRNYVNFGYLDVKATTFGQLRKAAGYATCITGKWQLNGNDKKSAVPAATRPKHFGFDEWCLWQMDEPGRVAGVGDTRYANPEFNINGKDSGITSPRNWLASLAIRATGFTAGISVTASRTRPAASGPARNATSSIGTVRSTTSPTMCWNKAPSKATP